MIRNAIPKPLTYSCKPFVFLLRTRPTPLRPLKFQNFAQINSLESAGFAHDFGAVVAVGSSAVPVSGHGLGVEADNDAVLFGHALQQEATDPQVVAHRDALAWTHLKVIE